MKQSFVLFITCLTLFSQDVETVISEGVYISSSVSSAKGFSKARKRALDKALEQVAGIEVQSSKLFQKKTNSDDEIISKYSSFMNSYSNATVRKEDILEQQISTIKEGNILIPKYYVRIKFEIVEYRKKADKAYKLKLALNKPAYIEGDEQIIGIQVSKDSYVSLFNFSFHDKVYILYPNALMESTRLAANKKREIPSLENRKSGIVFEVACAEGETVSSEIILAVATKKKIPLISSLDKETGFQYTDRASFQKWLSSIPLDQRSFNSFQYFIYKKKN